MKMKKRFLVVLLAIIYAVSLTTPGTAATGKPDDTRLAGADIETLSFEKLMDLGIFSKANAGNYQLDRPVTREELATLTVLASGQEYRLGFYRNNSLFSDVPASRWSNAQVGAAVSLGYMGALPDGKFHPADPVNFAVVATIVGERLGYSLQDLTGDWPENYLMLLTQKGILEGLSYRKDALVTRGQIAVILSRMLDASIKDETKTFIDMTGVYANVLLLNNNLTNPQLQNDSVATDKGVFRLAAGLAVPDAGHRLTIKYGNSTIQSYSDRDYTYTSAALKFTTSAGVLCQGGKTLQLPMDGTYCLNGNTTTRQNAIAALKTNSSIVISQDREGLAKYVMVYDPVYSLPKTMSAGTIGEASRTFGDDLIERDGKYVEPGQIEINDLVYRVTDIWGGNGYWIACHNRVSGKLDAIQPDKVHPDSVKVGGTVYALSPGFPLEKLVEGNAIKTGDRVTLMFGLDGNVADILLSLSGQNDMYALVLDAYSRESTKRETFGEKQYFVNLLHTDGSRQTCIVPSDMIEYKSDLVTYETTALAVDADDFDRVRLTPVTYQDAGEAEVHQSPRTLGSTYVADNAVIFNLIFSVYGRDSDASVLRWSDLPEGKLPPGKIKYIHKSGDFQDIDVMFIDNALDQDEELGLVTKVETAWDRDTGAIYKLTLLVDGQTMTYNSSMDVFAINDVLKLRVINGQILDIESWKTALTSSKTIEAVDDNRIRINGTTYSLSPSLSIYQYGTDGWKAAGTNKLTKGEYKQQISIYLDKSLSYGGKVTVILIH